MFLFYLPTIVWRGLYNRAGVDVDNILATAHTFSMTDSDENRVRKKRIMVNLIHCFLGNREKRRNIGCNAKCVKNSGRVCGRR